MGEFIAAFPLEVATGLDGGIVAGELWVAAEEDGTEVVRPETLLEEVRPDIDEPPTIFKLPPLIGDELAESLVVPGAGF